MVESAYKLPFSLAEMSARYHIINQQEQQQQWQQWQRRQQQKSSAFLRASSAFNPFITQWYSSKLPIWKQVMSLKEKETVKTCFFISFWLRRTLCFFCTSANKKTHSEMTKQYLFSFIIITGITLRSTQGPCANRLVSPVYIICWSSDKEKEIISL